MKEKNKKIKFKKWYLMPIFVVVFLCVFGFSIVKPVKAEYYTENPTLIGNTQYAFDIQYEMPIAPNQTFMIPSEVYNYSESVQTNPISTAISTLNPITGDYIHFGYIDQIHFWSGDVNNRKYGFNLYSSEYHFVSMFTNNGGYLTFVNDDFYLIQSQPYLDIFDNFDFTQTPYFSSAIAVNYNESSSIYYADLVSCEFYVDVFVPKYDDNGNVINTEVKKILTTYDFSSSHTSLSYEVNGVDTDILIYSDSGTDAYLLYPYRLVDYLIRPNYIHTEFFHITDFKIFTSIPLQTQTTGTDFIFEMLTPITRNDLVGFNITDYSSKISLNSYNLGASEFLQYEVYENNIMSRVEVDTTSWLITAVGAFMNAELFPGFAIGGIFAVMVAFPLVIWFLKVVLGG